MPNGKSVGTSASAKDMRSALDEMDMISFDMDSLEKEDTTQAQQDFQEIIEQDKPLLSAIRLGIQRMGAEDEKRLQMEYLIFNLQVQGDCPHTQDEVTQTLGCWINYRASQEIDMTRLRKIFAK